MTDDGVDRIVGQLGTQVVQLGNSTLRADLTVHGSILAVTVRILRVEVDGLIVESGSTATVLSQCTEVTLQDIGRSILLVGLQRQVGTCTGICSVLCLVEGATESDKILGVLLVLLVERLHLVVQVGGFATDDFLHGIDVGLGAVLCHSVGADTCQHNAHYYIFDCFHTHTLFKGLNVLLISLSLCRYDVVTI